MLDPRLAAVDARLADVDGILAVTGGKGGIGKSFVASALALVLSREGQRVGLLDLDFTSPSTHVILGYETGFPSEQWGIEPPEHQGLKYMSIAHFVGDRSTPLRGDDVTNALLELLTITRWGALDVLLVDMPPGLGDAALDAMRLLRRAEYLVVAGASKLVLASVRRNLELLQEAGAPLEGVIENMRRKKTSAVADLAHEMSAPFLGAIPYDESVEEALGDADRLVGTEAVRALRVAMADVRAALGGRGEEEE